MLALLLAVQLVTPQQGWLLDTPSGVVRLEQQVEGAFPNYVYQIPVQSAVRDTFFGSQWHLDNTGQRGKAGVDIDAPEGWEIKRRSNLSVGFVDTGVDSSHEDLVTLKFVSKNFISEGQEALDDFGHGTHMLGLGFAPENSIGVVGVVVDYQGTLYMAKAFDARGFGTTESIIKSWRWLAEQGITLINNSWGSASRDPFFEKFIREHPQIVFVCAAGNGPAIVLFPAAFSKSYANVISVAAINEFGEQPFFTSRSPTKVDLHAPGENIFSTLPKNSAFGNGDIPYGYLDGTSASAAIVTGILALALEHFQDTRIKERLIQTARYFPNLELQSRSGAVANLHYALTDFQSRVKVFPQWVKIDPYRTSLRILGFFSPKTEFIGDSVRGAMFVWTPVHSEPEYVVEMENGDRWRLEYPALRHRILLYDYQNPAIAIANPNSHPIEIKVSVKTPVSDFISQQLGALESRAFMLPPLWRSNLWLDLWSDAPFSLIAVEVLADRVRKLP